ncbi:MAG: hypothetical protein J2P23_07485 [Microlunatus sp.]|nr:hypothetical protein [Microlunatus sp.]
MLILSLLIRLAISTRTGMVGDNLAIAACLLVVLTGFIGTRIARRIDPALSKQFAERQRERDERVKKALKRH